MINYLCNHKVLPNAKSKLKYFYVSNGWTVEREPNSIFNSAVREVCIFSSF